MDDWPLTSRAIADSERATKGDYELTNDDEPERGHALRRELTDYEPIGELQGGVLYARRAER
jgi:hypothetical protein